MPNQDSARKSLRQTKKRAVRNKVRREAYRSAIKQTVKAVLSGAQEDAKKFAVTAQKALDKAAKTRVLNRKTAARKLSRLMKKVNAKAK